MLSYNIESPADAVWVRDYLCDGGVLACAAEGVWGLCCDPFNPLAVAQITSLKGRDSNKGYIVVSGQRDVFALLETQAQQMCPQHSHMLDTHWPGATSFVLPDPHQWYPPWISVKQQVVVRHTAHPQLKRLSALLASAVVSTSANPSGEPPALSQEEVEAYFGSSLPCIASAPLTPGSVSTIIDLCNGKYIR